MSLLHYRGNKDLTINNNSNEPTGRKQCDI